MVPTLWGEYVVDITSLRFTPPALDPDPEVIALLDDGYAHDVIRVSPVPPSSGCKVATYVSPSQVRLCAHQVVYGDEPFLTNGFLIESRTSPGLFHSCHWSPTDIEPLISTILHRKGAAPDTQQIQVPHHNYSVTCMKSPLFVPDAESFVPQQCVVKLICRNFGTIVEFSDGKTLRITDVTSPNGTAMISRIIRSQGVEIRNRLQDCRTSRCIALPGEKRRSKRSAISGTHCGGFLVYMYCPGAADAASVERLISEVEGKVEAYAQTLGSTITKISDISRKMTEAIVENSLRQEAWANQTAERLNRAFEEISRAHVSNREATRVSISQEAYIRDVFIAALSQRMYATEVLGEYKWYTRLMLAAARYQTDEMMAIIGERDLEVSNLLQAGYKFVASASVSTTALDIVYSRPRGYTIHLTPLPYRPYLRLEDQCSEDHCGACISQAPASMTVRSAVDGEPLGDSEVSVTPFSVAPCSRTGAPSYMVLHVKTRCVNITVHSTEIVPCPPPSEYPKLETPALPNIHVEINFTEAVPLGLPYMSHLSGAVELAQMEIEAEAATRGVIAKMNNALESVTSSHAIGMSQLRREATAGVVLGSLSLTMILGALIWLTVTQVQSATRLAPTVGYAAVQGQNKTACKIGSHRLHLFCLRDPARDHVVWYHVHTKEPNVLVIQGGEPKLELNGRSLALGKVLVESSQVYQCYCPESDIIEVSAYPPSSMSSHPLS